MAFFMLAIRIVIGVVSAIGIADIVYNDSKNKVMKPSIRPKKEEDEYDSKIVDGVRVSLFTKKVEWLSSSGSSSGSLTGEMAHSEHFRHWALVFKFPNGRVITYEANEKKGHLVWSCMNDAPKEVNGSKLYPNITRCRTSPKRLQDIARNININYKPYNMCFNNCQVWVISFVKELGYDVYSSFVTKFESVYEKEPFLAYLAGLGYAVANSTKI